MTAEGRAGGAMDIGTESGIDKLVSNSNIISCAHYITNILGKGMDPSLEG